MSAESTLTISLPEPMRRWVEEQAASSEYGTISDYIIALVHEDQRRRDMARLERHLLDAMDTELAEMSEQDWERIRAKALRS